MGAIRPGILTTKVVPERICKVYEVAPVTAPQVNAIGAVEPTEAPAAGVVKAGAVGRTGATDEACITMEEAALVPALLKAVT